MYIWYTAVAESLELCDKGVNRKNWHFVVKQKKFYIWFPASSTII